MKKPKTFYTNRTVGFKIYVFVKCDKYFSTLYYTFESGNIGVGVFRVEGWNVLWKLRNFWSATVINFACFSIVALAFFLFFGINARFFFSRKYRKRRKWLLIILTFEFGLSLVTPRDVYCIPYFSLKMPKRSDTIHIRACVKHTVYFVIFIPLLSLCTCCVRLPISFSFFVENNYKMRWKCVISNFIYARLASQCE